MECLFNFKSMEEISVERIDEYEEFDSIWNTVPDPILLHIFQYLTARELLEVGLTCQAWNYVSYDEVLWKRLLYRNFKIDTRIPIAPGKTSWYEEYKRLHYYTPINYSEVLCQHEDQVLHVSYSHDGTMFASSSKDGYVIVWTSGYPIKTKYSHDMKVYKWKYTQFSQFNQSDTLLLVSGVHCGTTTSNFTSNSGEIAVFSLHDGFNLQCRVGNKPYDIFGTWYSDRHLLSGDHHWLAQHVSTTGLWINKASQETASEISSIPNQLFRFYNPNFSSVRTVMIADRASNEMCTNETVKLGNQTKPNLQVKSHHCICENSGAEVKKCDCAQKRCLEGSDNDGSITEGSAASSNYDDDGDLERQPEKLLMFTTGSKTFTPHQIGFKVIKRVNLPKAIDLDPGPSLKERIAASPSLEEPDWLNYEAVIDKFDKIDHVIDLHGHIVGMGLSPDHRYLYVNSRPWPEGYHISNIQDPPPIAQEIEIHVIDLVTFSQVGRIFRSHKAYTPNNECFFIFLDVSNEYVASGSEDKHGYIWDRHYGVCLGKLPHKDVVNSAVFNPADPQMLVTTSDDFTIKIWRSRAFMKSS